MEELHPRWVCVVDREGDPWAFRREEIESAAVGDKTLNVWTLKGREFLVECASREDALAALRDVTS